MSKWVERVLEVLPGAKAYTREEDGLAVILSEEKYSDGLWQHLSVSRASALPSLQDIQDVRGYFISENQEVLLVLPPQTEYEQACKNYDQWAYAKGRPPRHPFTLHMWHRVGKKVCPDWRQQNV